MTSLKAMKKLLSMAKEKSLVPWHTVIGGESDTIRFNGCTFFFFDNFVAVWNADSDELETIWYDKIVETDFIKWVDMIESMKEVE